MSQLRLNILLLCTALLSALTFEAHAESLVCKEVPTKNSFHQRTVCTQAQSSMTQLYESALKKLPEGKYLLPKLPTQAQYVEKSDVAIDYQPSGCNEQFRITFGFSGGQTDWVLSQNRHFVKLVIDYYQD